MNATPRVFRVVRSFKTVTRATLPKVEKSVWRSEFVREKSKLDTYRVDFDGAKPSDLPWGLVQEGGCCDDVVAEE